MIGKLFDSDPEFYNYLSSFWSIKRHKWIKGPKLPKEIAEEIIPTQLPCLRQYLSRRILMSLRGGVFFLESGFFEKST